MSKTHQVVVYDRQTGYVLSSGTTCVPERLETSSQRVLADAGARPGLDYVQGGRILSRPMLPARLAGRVLRGVPAGAEIHIEDKVYVADGSDIELAFSLPGRYLITIKCRPHLDWSATYEA